MLADGVWEMWYRDNPGIGQEVGLISPNTPSFPRLSSAQPGFPSKGSLPSGPSKKQCDTHGVSAGAWHQGGLWTEQPGWRPGGSKVWL